MAERRALRGKPLMVATAGVVLAIGCGGPKGGGGPVVVGNLVAPPMVELCVKTEPDDATVKMNGAVAEGGCAMVYEGPVMVEVSHEDHETTVQTIVPGGEVQTIRLDPNVE